VAKAADQFRSTDITRWGIVALSCWGAAVLLANVSGLVPADIFGFLHASRLESATLAQVRAEVATLRTETDRVRQENTILVQRLDLAERARSEVTQRVGALEVSLPQIVERIPEPIAIDRSVTASIVGGNAVSFDADGGSVRVEQKPLVAIEPRPAEQADASEPAPAADGSRYGVALGFPVMADDAEALWQEMLAKVGTLLVGTWPVLGDVDGSDGQQLVAGPVGSASQAAELCGRMDRVGIPCEPTRFEGDPLPILN